MRLILLAFTVLIAANIGLAAADMLKDTQDQRMSQLCKHDSSYCL